ncbi:MAG: DUF4491 family protein [Oscillibacter sp.]|nr:DUF4491 family protein [Oscillibacter sp.]
MPFYPVSTVTRKGERKALSRLTDSGLGVPLIGLFHPIIIQCEYHFSYRVWPAFLIAGLALLIASVHAANVIVSSLPGAHAERFRAIQEIIVNRD